MLVPTLGSRREFLRWGGLLAGVAPWFPQSVLAAAPDTPRAAGKARGCILVYLLGGPPHQDMWDLKPAAPAEIRGPFKPISTSVPGLQICEHLPRLAQRAHQFALLRAVSHPNSNHTPMIYYTLTGRHVRTPELDNDISLPAPTDHPHLGSVVAHFRPTRAGLPGYVAMPEVAIRSSDDFVRAATPLRGGRAGILGAVHDPLVLNGDPRAGNLLPSLNLPAEMTEERFEQRQVLLSRLDAIPRASVTRRYAEFRQTAVAMTGARGSAALYSLDQEPAALREKYGSHRFGQSLLMARRLVEAGIPLVAVHFNHMTRCDGWDTHAKNFEACQQELLPMVDQGLSALLDDLTERNLLDETIVACLGEFGRTPRINANAGRDHWGDCSSAWLAGGGIQGGRVLGASDKHAAYPAGGKVDPVDIHATLLHALGVPPDGVIHDPLGRPLSICNGQVIRGILA